MMERITLKVATTLGCTEEVVAWTTSTPGLVVHEYHDSMNAPWRVTHQRSGACLVAVADPETAHKMAAGLRSIRDWTLPGDEIDRNLGVEVRQAIGADLVGPWRPVLPDINTVTT